MRCPVCDNTDLLMGERLNIQIDYCPKCRGIWLDKGKLDKIIEQGSHGSPKSTIYKDEYKDEYKDDYRQGHHDDDDYKHGHRKKRSFFDVFGGDDD